MGKLLRVLEKVGLVESEADASAQDSAPDPAPEIEPAAMAQEVVADAPPPVLVDGNLQEQRPFDDIYAEQGVESAAFSADKLLRILDGLAALDPVSRKAAVIALDSADDSWSLDEVLADAERRTRALDAAKRQLEAHVRSALQEAREAIEARDQKQNDAVTRIRQQITDLEALLQREVTRSTEEKAALEANARATKDACVRESARLDQERTRLGRIAEIFGTDKASSPPSS
jgi:hypothetical protein